jgi:hypothetical protein
MFADLAAHPFDYWLVRGAAALVAGGVLWRYLFRHVVSAALEIIGRPPDASHPHGQPGLIRRLDRQDAALAEVQGGLERVANIATNGLSTNVARSLEYAERAAEKATAAEVTAAEAKEAARLAAEQAEQLIEGQATLAHEVALMSQRTREKREAALAILAEIPGALWDVLVEHAERLPDVNDEGEDGST